MGNLKESSENNWISWKPQGIPAKTARFPGKHKESRLKQLDFLESTRNPG